MEQLANAAIYIDDTPSLGLSEMRAKARRLQQSIGKLDLLIVDYLQLMSGGSRRYENRTQEVSAISRGLKALAKELNVPVIALSQLSRAPESRGGDHRPQLADLRESGSIEQDADLVAFIFREEVYKPDDPELDGRAELIIAKQRNGPTGKVSLAFLKNCTRFASLAEGTAPEE
jgi:replicative DNA helicase